MSLFEPLREFLATRSNSAYLVGGALRDILLARETHDLDVSVRENAAKLARAFADEIGAAYFLMDEAFDVARVILDREGTRDVVDFARQRGNSIKDDLATRDFTVNAMAADLVAWHGDPEDIIDPFEGRADVQARQIRAVSDKVFQNDPVRMMRAIRLEAELNFVLAEETEQWVRRDAHLIASAPMERVRDELMRTLGADNVLRNLRRLDAVDLLGRVLPELDGMRGVTQSPPHVYEVYEHSLHAVAAAEELEHEGYMRLAEGAFGAQLREHFAQPVAGGRTRRELLRLALLLHDIGKAATRTVEPSGRIRFLRHENMGAELAEPALRRLKFSNDEVAQLKLMIAHHMRPLSMALNGCSDKAIHRYFRDTGSTGVDIAVHAWCDRRAAFGGDSDDPEVYALEGVIARLLDRYYHARETVVYPPALVNGSEVMNYLKVPPGPRVGQLLIALREAQAAGEVSTREEALEFLGVLNSRQGI